jgi:hypothetical protein
MGNYFQKEIICDECKKQNIKPEYFTNKYLCNDEEAILFESTLKYDNFGNEIKSTKLQKNLLQYTCSNNHIFYYKK